MVTARQMTTQWTINVGTKLNIEVQQILENVFLQKWHFRSTPWNIQKMLRYYYELVWKAGKCLMEMTHSESQTVKWKKFVIFTSAKTE